MLSLGDFKALYADNQLYAFRRDWAGQTAVVVFNANLEAAVLDLEGMAANEAGRAFRDVWNIGEYRVAGGKLASVRVPARDAVVLVADE